MTNEVMNFFSPVAKPETFDQIQIAIASPDQIPKTFMIYRLICEFKNICFKLKSIGHPDLQLYIRRINAIHHVGVARMFF